MRAWFNRFIVPGRRFLVCVSVSLALAAGTRGASATPLKCWKLVAASDAIVQGRTFAVAGDVPQSERRLALKVNRWLKGTESGNSDLLILDRLGVFAQVGQDVTAFLVKPTAGSPYYLTIHGAEASCQPLEAVSERSTADLICEVERQNQAVASFEDIALLVRQHPTHRIVLENINALVSATEESKALAFERLLLGGPKTVPALIVLMTDDRTIPRGLVEVPNLNNGAFESRSHHNPRTVFDAVVLVLGNLTNGSFGSEPGGDAATRRRVISAWRTFLAYKEPNATK